MIEKRMKLKDINSRFFTLNFPLYNYTGGERRIYYKSS